MSRLRKIYKGEDVIFYEDQNNILGKGTILNENQNFKIQIIIIKIIIIMKNNDNNNKIKNNNNNDLNIMNNLNKENNNILEDLIFGDDKNNKNNKIQNKLNEDNKTESNNTITDEDFEDFNYDREEEEKNNITKIYLIQNKKRTFSEAFPETKKKCKFNF